MERKVDIFINDDYEHFLDTLEKNSVDFICIDPPYGKNNGMQLSGQKDVIQWDVTINWKTMFEKFNRVLKPGCAIAVFGQNPTYSQMVLSNLKQYKYEYIWVKNNAAQGFHANKMPLVFTENIAIFIKPGNNRIFNKPSKAIDIPKDEHFTRWYAQQVFKFIGKPGRQIHKELGHRKLEFFRCFNGKHFGMVSEDLYNTLINKYHIDKSNFFIPYKELKAKWEAEKEHSKGVKFDAAIYNGMFNNVLKFDKDFKPYYHPTQKPIALIKTLIEIYTNQNGVVLDCFAGSGTTMVAAIRSGRHYLGCELDKKFYDVACNRIKKETQ